MGREKKSLPQAVAGGPKERHRRIPKSQFDPKAPVPDGFMARPAVPKSKSKHHAYFEFVANKNKKKKLEYQVTTKSTPPPGFEFVPTGNPALTTACKELSRDKDAMIFIVSNTKEIDPNHLSHHVHRTGYHIREAIVEEARTALAHLPHAAASNGEPEPLPTSQDEYTAQANSAILDLFPRIPNTDRQSIIVHAFNLASINQRPKPVGLVTDMPLSRRVQLAVLAHIRHNHTRYDDLLKETSWQNARKVVEALCLDILVKWRGDEETGRDQLDEILREVVVISDSDSEESEEEDDDTQDTSNDDMDMDGRMDHDHPGSSMSQGMSRDQRLPTQNQPQGSEVPVVISSRGDPGPHPQHRTTARKEQRGFKRYRAWEEAIRRNRGDESQPVAPAMAPSVSHGSHQYYGSAAHGPRPVGISGGAGSVPEPNGFVPRQPPSGLSSIVSPPDHTARPVHDQVTDGVHNRKRTTPSHSRHVTPVADRLQDMLVRSVEPTSPETTMQPSFVRALPPRPQPSPARRSMPFRPESPSPSRETGTRDRPFYVERRVGVDHPPTEPLPQRQRGDPYSHHQPAPGYYDSRPLLHSPLSAAETRAHQSSDPSAPARRIAVGVGRPGDRAHPILMEDRGGFFERVHEQPEIIPPGSSNVDAGSSQWPSQTPRGLPESRRVVSWEEGSRILRESHNDRGVEVIPPSGPRTLPPGAPPHGTYMDAHSAPRPYDSWARREPHGENYYHEQVAGLQPPRRDYLEPPLETRREVRYDRPPLGDPRYYQQPAHQQHDQPRYVGPHAHPAFGRTPQGRDDVIVLE